MGIKLMLVDDHQMFVDALDLLLTGEGEVEVVGRFRMAEDAVAACEESCPDVVLMDMDLPGMDGVEGTRRIKQLCPEAQIVIITAFQQREIIVRAIEAGATGYVPKTHAADELSSIIRRAAAGEVVLPAGDLGAVLESLEKVRQERTEAQRRLAMLTSREREVLFELTKGKSTAEIARTLFISPQTVQSHVKSILMKMGVRSKLEAVLEAVRYGVGGEGSFRR